MIEVALLVWVCTQMNSLVIIFSVIKNFSVIISMYAGGKMHYMNN